MLFFQLHHNNKELKKQLTKAKAELTSGKVAIMKLETAVALLEKDRLAELEEDYQDGFEVRAQISAFVFRN